MYAVVRTGGKQYKVQPGDQLKVEKLPGDPGSTITLTEVLAVCQTDGIQLGTPFIEGTSVEATILRTARDRKVIVFKKKRRQGYHKKQGHRQWYTLLRIDGISSGHVEPVKQRPKEETKSLDEEIKAEPMAEAASEPKREPVEDKPAKKVEAKSASKTKAKKEKDPDKSAEEKSKATKAKAKKPETPATKAAKSEEKKTTKTKSSASKADSAEKKPKAKPKKKSSGE